MNERTAKLFGRYARSVVPRDLEGANRLERLLTKQIKAQWRSSNDKEKAKMRRDMLKTVKAKKVGG